MDTETIIDDTRNMIVDPPSGWKYGFPRPYINKEKVPLNEWLLDKGYPQREIDLWGGGEVPCRWWEDRRP